MILAVTAFVSPLLFLDGKRKLKTKFQFSIYLKGVDQMEEHLRQSVGQLKDDLTRTETSEALLIDAFKTESWVILREPSG